jgi:hypothetical protein
MPSDINATIRVQSRTPRRRGAALLGGGALIAGLVFLLCINIGFARYAVSGFLWIRADGTVLTSCRTSDPTIQFLARNGAAHQFKEDYVILCGGRRSLCFIRDFNPHQVVPVVYDPGNPDRAFVSDWALTAGVITWVGEAVAGLLLALMMFVSLVRKPLNIRIGMGNRADAQ